MTELQLLSKAIFFSAVAHRNQRRKDVNKTPYINHPLDLMNIAIQAGITDIIILIACLLHDTIEDTNVTYDDLVREFNKEIADIVMEVSDDKTLPKPERKALQISHARHASDKAKVVKLCDKIANVKDMRNYKPEGWSDERADQYFIWAKAVVDELRGTNSVLESQFDSFYP